MLLLDPKLKIPLCSQMFLRFVLYFLKSMIIKDIHKF